MKSTTQSGQAVADGMPSTAELRDALSRVVSSEAFVSAPRLQQFLTYVVDETIAGRGAAISGKSIAVDVYDRDLGGGESGQNLVRVEARRLRRRLKEYYRGPGADDPWRILIDLGGYTPRFEAVAAANSTDRRLFSLSAMSPFHRRIVLAATVMVLALSILGIAVNLRPVGNEAVSTTDESTRAAYRERSMPALQAVNLAEQARGMLFPVFDLRRQEIALQMFQHVISLDPGLHNGYSGAAQVLATLALTAPDAAATSDFLAEAVVMAEMALDRAPSSPWAHAANGWVLVVSGDISGGVLSARLAVELGPEEGHILDLAGLTAIVGNAPQFAAEVSAPERPRSGVGRFAANNVWGVAQFVLGDYTKTIDAFSNAPESGDPVSAPSLIFLAAAYDRVGEMEKASEIVAELNATWPDFPAVPVIHRIFRNSPDIGDDVIERLTKHRYLAPESDGDRD